MTIISHIPGRFVEHWFIINPLNLEVLLWGRAAKA